MTKIVVDVPPELYRKIGLKKEQEELKKKESVIINIIREYFTYFDSKETDPIKDKIIEDLKQDIKKKEKIIENLIQGWKTV